MMKRFLPLALSIVLAFTASSLAANPTYDVVVYGGTSGGVTAAVQAARMGRSVVLIENSRHLGGLSSGGLSKTDIGNRNSVGGLAREFYDRVGDAYDTGLETNFEPHVAERVFDQMVEKAGVTVVRGEWLDRADGVNKENGRITAITMESGRTFRGRMFVDTTYVGDLMAAAGVSYTVGREPADQYDESLAGMINSKQYVKVDLDPYVEPGNPSSGLIAGVQRATPIEEGAGDDLVQAYNYRLCLTKREDNKIAITRPERYDPADYELLARYFEARPNLTLRDVLLIGKLRRDKVDVNNWGYSAMSTDYIGGNYDYPEGSYDTRREIEHAHKQHIEGLLWFLGSDQRVPADVRREMREWGYAADEFEDNDHWPYALYVREARRMIGPYVMIQADCEGRRVAERSIALGSYNMDSHTVQRYVNADGYMRKDGFFIKSSATYPIDYRAITPRAEQCQNLLVPVCLSASHAAFGSIRMEPVFMILGQSAATAACHAIEDEVAVQDVDYPRLRQRLLADGQILEYTGPRRRSTRGVDPATLPGVVIDNESATRTGRWLEAGLTAPRVGASYHHDGDQGKGELSARYETELEPGRYEVRLSWPVNPNRATNVPVAIHHAGGVERLTVNQRQTPKIDDLFEPLGTFEFTGQARVEITNAETDGHVLLDAVQFVPADQ